MAELAVATAVASVELLLSFLKKKNVKEDDVQVEVQSMQSWLKTMKAFIEDNNGRESSRMMEDQMEKIVDAAYEIEDVLEEFVLHSSYVFHHHKITKKAYKVGHDIKHGFPLRSISNKIETIKRKLEDIKAQNLTFSDGSSNSRPTSSSGVKIGHRVSPLLLDNEMFGYEKQKEEFIGQLMNGELGLVRLAVTGPGGSGKSTFVKNVVWKGTICRQFDCHAWVHVSRHLNADEIFLNLLKQFCASSKEQYSADDGLGTLLTLSKYLEGKKYIVVVDDIWKKEDWDCIMDALPGGVCGSRIVVTTRDFNVASLCASSPQYICELNGLQWLEAWTLFCKKTFADNNGECPSELKDSSRRIVTRCEGLPLAIVAVGSALALKPKLPHEFEKFHKSLGIGSSSHLSVISNTLLPGYIDLSSNLKNCFLYFSIFPEDYSVERGRLIRLWVAERFVMGTSCETAEEVGEGYLNELINRNLVHVSKWDFDGRPRNCRVLNLVLNFIFKKCKDENFASVFSGESTSESKKFRRLSFHNDCTHFPGDNGGVRSLFLFRCVNIITSDIGNDFRDFQLLRILDFQGAPLIEFPQQITHLTLLRYISLRETEIKIIPHSIKKLFYLETLDLKQTNVDELPKQISRLHNLRHLFAYKKKVKHSEAFDSVQGVTLSEGIENLTELLDLSHVEVGQKGEILKDLKKLTKLRKLGLTGLKREHGNALAASIENMKKLVTLSLSSATKGEYLGLKTINPPPTLQRLYLRGKLEQLPSWINRSLCNLSRIGLKWSKLQESPLQALQHLPNLMELQLVDCYTKEELMFEASSFKKLKILQIEQFSRLHTIVIQQGVMPQLKKMSLCRCPNLNMLPLGIDNLDKVEELVLHDMSDKFIARLSQDRDLVNHIPFVKSKIRFR